MPSTDKVTHIALTTPDGTLLAAIDDTLPFVPRHVHMWFVVPEIDFDVDQIDLVPTFRPATGVALSDDPEPPAEANDRTVRFDRVACVHVDGERSALYVQHTNA